MIMTGAQAVVKSLEDEGVRVVFGLPGGTVIPLYDALYSSSIKHVLVRHEQAAASAADGYSRACRSINPSASLPVGVCIATSGPGAMNLMMGISTAYHDSAPMLAIVGQVAMSALGTDFFQEEHILGVSMPIVKHGMRIERHADIPIMIRDALTIARSGRPGPVLLELPVDIQNTKGEYARPNGTFFPKLVMPQGVSPAPLSRDELNKAAGMIQSASRPLIIAGNGVNISRAWGGLADFASQLGIPVVTTLLGKGAIPDDSKGALGMIGVHGLEAANRALLAADLLIAVGTRFSDRSTGRSSAFAERRVIHIDIDRAEMGKNINTSAMLAGDAQTVLRELLALSSSGKAPRELWTDELSRTTSKTENKNKDDQATRRELTDPATQREMTGQATRREMTENENNITPRMVFEALNEATRGELTVTTEVGQHQMWTAQHLASRLPGRFITSGGQGSMGFGLPAAMGACLARPEEAVICVAGDGSFMMNIQELDTCARYSLPVKILLFDNGCLGMVRQWQQLFYGARYSNTIYGLEPDYEAIARGFGVAAYTARAPEDLGPAIRDALATPGPALVRIKIPQEANVFPIVPPGETLDKMLL